MTIIRLMCSEHMTEMIILRLTAATAEAAAATAAATAAEATVQWITDFTIQQSIDYSLHSQYRLPCFLFHKLSFQLLATWFS